MEHRTIKVSKLDAARRQLDCALELWFHDGDDVSIRTLSSAVYQIVHDINQASGSPRDLLYDTLWIKDQYLREFVRMLKEPANFFKHADKDPDPKISIEFSPEISPLLLMLIQSELRYLGERPTDIQLAFLTWLAVHKPDVIDRDSFLIKYLESLPTEARTNMRSLSKSDFLRAVREGLAAGRKIRPPRH